MLTMTNELQVFMSEQFGQLRVTEIDGKPYTVANDVLKALGYSEGGWRTTLSRKCKGVTKCNGLKVNGIEINLIPEGDIYRLIAGSILPEAEKFESWVFDIVLPTIRKHGTYMSEEVIEKTLNDPDFIIQLATQLKDERQKRLIVEQQLQEAQPKLDKYGVFLDAEGTYTFEQVSKMISTRSEEKGSRIKVNKKSLTSILRDCGILSKNKTNGRYRNLPNVGFENYFNINHESVDNRDDIDNEQTRVKTIGIDYIYDLLLDRRENGLVVFG